MPGDAEPRRLRRYQPHRQNSRKQLDFGARQAGETYLCESSGLVLVKVRIWRHCFQGSSLRWSRSLLPHWKFLARKSRSDCLKLERAFGLNSEARRLHVEENSLALFAQSLAVVLRQGPSLSNPSSPAGAKSCRRDSSSSAGFHSFADLGPDCSLCRLGCAKMQTGPAALLCVHH